MVRVFLGNNELKTNEKKVGGEIVNIDGEQHYKISNYDAMPPFFMSIVSESDLWMYISSNGALTAGRCDADNALFPYYTDDRIHDSQDITGSKTIFIITKNNKKYLWEPFSAKYRNIYNCRFNLYKNLLGNKLVFEEINNDLEVTFQYSWLNADEFGFVKKSTVKNIGRQTVYIEILDGVQNILPSGIDRKFQLEYSTLVDGYKKSELIPKVKLGLYMLSSVPVDRAEPSESLTATIAWSAGLDDAIVLLSSTQLEKFRRGVTLQQETDIRANRGAYFLNSVVSLAPTVAKTWHIIIDLNKDQSEVAALCRTILVSNDPAVEVKKAIARSTEALQLKIAKADGCQLTSDALNVFRHSANTMFNIMRGGIFDDDYVIDKKDFTKFILAANNKTAEKYDSLIKAMPDEIDFQALLTSAAGTNAVFTRLRHEYLPLSFSRRHGDPSRPWNTFSIDIKDDNGHKKLNYQGNWRDIFQNWEALAHSFPEFIESMITKFVNASTADGYNPYRVVRDGFDWEVLDHHDAWSYIGYWGDHQIIYLQKLLEISCNYHRGKLQALLTNKIFTYANVPYKIKSYQEILQDPCNTVDFDSELNAVINDRVAELGSDGKFMFDSNDDIYTVNLAEKLLVPMLVKLSNFIPEAGIWMNTQRPEWNDANNALVGNGASMVTLYYLRRYISFAIDLFTDAGDENFEISGTVAQLFTEIEGIFKNNLGLLLSTISDKNRKDLTDQLSTAGTKHRQTIYTGGFSGNFENISASQLAAFLIITLKYIDHSIAANKRTDDLFQTYNLITLKENEISIRHLYEMLEGQVAALSSGYLSTKQALNLLRSLEKSPLYRKDQNSYILYPDRQLAHFTEKNIIPPQLLETSLLINKLIAAKDRDIVLKDVNGDVHFHKSFRNAKLLDEALDRKNISPKDKTKILDIYEAVFDHQSFTGRSGTFYKYEGLGSIYWHMVSKLLLSVQENFYMAVNSGATETEITEIRDFYYKIRAGIGFHKNPADYGAFPTDPYSHTPGHCGVQQPGMTGQVKEDVISRFGELGIVVKNGELSFAVGLLDKKEFLTGAGEFQYYNHAGEKATLSLEKNSLAFTIAQVPVVYKLTRTEKVRVYVKKGSVKTFPSLFLDKDTSALVFSRSGEVIRIEVMIKL